MAGAPLPINAGYVTNRTSDDVIARATQPETRQVFGFRFRESMLA